MSRLFGGVFLLLSILFLDIRAFLLTPGALSWTNQQLPPRTRTRQKYLLQRHESDVPSPALPLPFGRDGAKRPVLLQRPTARSFSPWRGKREPFFSPWRGKRSLTSSVWTGKHNVRETDCGLSKKPKASPQKTNTISSVHPFLGWFQLPPFRRTPNYFRINMLGQTVGKRSAKTSRRIIIQTPDFRYAKRKRIEFHPQVKHFTTSSLVDLGRGLTSQDITQVDESGDLHLSFDGESTNSHLHDDFWHHPVSIYELGRNERSVKADRPVAFDKGYKATRVSSIQDKTRGNQKETGQALSHGGQLTTASKAAKRWTIFETSFEPKLQGRTPLDDPYFQYIIGGHSQTGKGPFIAKEEETFKKETALKNSEQQAEPQSDDTQTEPSLFLPSPIIIWRQPKQKPAETGKQNKKHSKQTVQDYETNEKHEKAGPEFVPDFDQPIHAYLPKPKRNRLHSRVNHLKPPSYAYFDGLYRNSLKPTLDIGDLNLNVDDDHLIQYSPVAVWHHPVSVDNIGVQLPGKIAHEWNRATKTLTFTDKVGVADKETKETSSSKNLGLGNKPSKLSNIPEPVFVISESSGQSGSSGKTEKGEKHGHNPEDKTSIDKAPRLPSNRDKGETEKGEKHGHNPEDKTSIDKAPRLPSNRDKGETEKGEKHGHNPEDKTSIDKAPRLPSNRDKGETKDELMTTLKVPGITGQDSGQGTSDNTGVLSGSVTALDKFIVRFTYSGATSKAVSLKDFGFTEEKLEHPTFYNKGRKATTDVLHILEDLGISKDTAGPTSSLESAKTRDKRDHPKGFQKIQTISGQDYELEKLLQELDGEAEVSEPSGLSVGTSKEVKHSDFTRLLQSFNKAEEEIELSDILEGVYDDDEEATLSRFFEDHGDPDFIDGLRSHRFIIDHSQPGVGPFFFVEELPEDNSIEHTTHAKAKENPVTQSKHIQNEPMRFFQRDTVQEEETIEKPSPVSDSSSRQEKNLIGLHPGHEPYLSKSWTHPKTAECSILPAQPILSSHPLRSPSDSGITNKGNTKQSTYNHELDLPEFGAFHPILTKSNKTPKQQQSLQRPSHSDLSNPLDNMMAPLFSADNWNTINQQFTSLTPLPSKTPNLRPQTKFHFPLQVPGHTSNWIPPKRIPSLSSTVKQYGEKDRPFVRAISQVNIHDYLKSRSEGKNAVISNKEFADNLKSGSEDENTPPSNSEFGDDTKSSPEDKEYLISIRQFLDHLKSVYRATEPVPKNSHAFQEEDRILISIFGRLSPIRGEFSPVETGHLSEDQEGTRAHNTPSPVKVVRTGEPQKSHSGPSLTDFARSSVSLYPSKDPGFLGRHREVEEDTPFGKKVASYQDIAVFAPDGEITLSADNNGYLKIMTSKENKISTSETTSTDSSSKNNPDNCNSTGISSVSQNLNTLEDIHHVSHGPNSKDPNGTVSKTEKASLTTTKSQEPLNAEKVKNSQLSNLTLINSDKNMKNPDKTHSFEKPTTKPQTLHNSEKAVKNHKHYKTVHKSEKPTSNHESGNALFTNSDTTEKSQDGKLTSQKSGERVGRTLPDKLKATKTTQQIIFDSGTSADFSQKTQAAPESQKEAHRPNQSQSFHYHEKTSSSHNVTQGPVDSENTMVTSADPHRSNFNSTDNDKQGSPQKETETTVIQTFDNESRSGDNQRFNLNSAGNDKQEKPQEETQTIVEQTSDNDSRSKVTDSTKNSFPLNKDNDAQIKTSMYKTGTLKKELAKIIDRLQITEDTSGIVEPFVPSPYETYEKGDNTRYVKDETSDWVEPFISSSYLTDQKGEDTRYLTRSPPAFGNRERRSLSSFRGLFGKYHNIRNVGHAHRREKSRPLGQTRKSTSSKLNSHRENYYSQELGESYFQTQNTGAEGDREGLRLDIHRNNNYRQELVSDQFTRAQTTREKYENEVLQVDSHRDKNYPHEFRGQNTQTQGTDAETSGYLTLTRTPQWSYTSHQQGNKVSQTNDKKLESILIFPGGKPNIYYWIRRRKATQQRAEQQSPVSQKESEESLTSQTHDPIPSKEAPHHTTDGMSRTGAGSSSVSGEQAVSAFHNDDDGSVSEIPRSDPVSLAFRDRGLSQQPQKTSLVLWKRKVYRRMLDLVQLLNNNFNTFSQPINNTGKQKLKSSEQTRSLLTAVEESRVKRHKSQKYYDYYASRALIMGNIGLVYSDHLKHHVPFTNKYAWWKK